MQIVIEIDPARILGWRTVFSPMLLVPFTCSPEPSGDSQVQLHSLEGWIAWNPEQISLGGIRIPMQTVGPYTSRLLVPITDEQIETIEANRTDEAVILTVAFNGLASIPASNPQIMLRTSPGQPSSNSPLELHQVRDSTDMGERLRIEHAHWLEILAGLGAGKRRLIELPEPTLPVGQEQWAECLRLHTEATKQYREHGFDSVLSNCRKVVEGITEILCSRWGIAREPNKPFTVWSKDLPTQLGNVWTVDREDSIMFYALLIASWKWTSSSHHYGSGIPYRDEVSFALSLTTDLIMFSAKVLAA